jgi:hypothetical protein
LLLTPHELRGNGKQLDLPAHLYNCSDGKGWTENARFFTHFAGGIVQTLFPATVDICMEHHGARTKGTPTIANIHYMTFSQSTPVGDAGN